MKHNIAALRKEYSREALDESGVSPDPIVQFSFWWKEASESMIDDVNAMTLATADGEGRPSARIVLLKGFHQEGFVFYTNYESRKGMDLAKNPFASIVFYWKELERQVRVEGRVEKVSFEESELYFKSRPEGSKVGAWASPQSKVIPGREFLEKRVSDTVKDLEGKEIECPQFWGGYLLKPDMFEFWQGRPSRLHDRIRYSRDGGTWKIERLAP